jgi:hypothetical protein
MRGQLAGSYPSGLPGKHLLAHPFRLGARMMRDAATLRLDEWRLDFLNSVATPVGRVNWSARYIAMIIEQYLAYYIGYRAEYCPIYD